MLTEKSLTDLLWESLHAMHEAKLMLQGVSTDEVTRLKAADLLSDAAEVIADLDTTLAWIKADLASK